MRLNQRLWLGTPWELGLGMCTVRMGLRGHLSDEPSQRKYPGKGVLLGSGAEKSLIIC